MNATTGPAGRRSGRYLRLGLFLALVLALNTAGTWLTWELDIQLFPRHEPLLHAMVLGTAALYVLLMATPFMPGIEFGLALMVTLGPKGALLVYLCTVLALAISFAVGRCLPPGPIAGVLDWFHLTRAAGLVRRLAPLGPRERLAELDRRAPARLAPLLLRHRYLAIALLLNLPGNALIGGGGGIALVAGMSRVVPFPAFVALVAMAVAPVPLAFFLR